MIRCAIWIDVKTHLLNTCNFNKRSNPPWVFFTFIKLSKIAQNIPYICIHSKKAPLATSTHHRKNSSTNPTLYWQIIALYWQATYQFILNAWFQFQTTLFQISLLLIIDYSNLHSQVCQIKPFSSNKRLDSQNRNWFTTEIGSFSQFRFWSWPGIFT